MKIGINATFLHEKPTGLGVFTEGLSRFITTRLNGEALVFSPIPVEGVTENSFRRVPLSIKGSMRFRNNLFRTIYLNTVLPLRCRHEKIDVLFCPMIEFPFIPVVPLVVHVHDLHPIQFSSQFGRAAVFLRLSLHILKRVVKRITVSSGYVKKELLKATGIREEKIDIVPLAYNESLFHTCAPEEESSFFEKYSLKRSYILSVGNLFPYKNINTLTEAFLKIKDRIDHCLVIVGRKEFASGRLVEDERIFYMDYVPDEDLPRFYSYADLLVHPSLSEGFGLTPLEAMACGTPVVSSNAGALPEVVGDAGISFDPVDTRALSDIILDVLNNKGLRGELIEKGFKRIKLFSWEKTAAGILRTCERAATGKK